MELDIGLRERVAPVVHRLLRHLAGSQGVVEDPDLVDHTVEVRRHARMTADRAAGLRPRADAILAGLGAGVEEAVGPRAGLAPLRARARRRAAVALVGHAHAVGVADVDLPVHVQLQLRIIWVLGVVGERRVEDGRQLGPLVGDERAVVRDRGKALVAAAAIGHFGVRPLLRVDPRAPRVSGREGFKRQREAGRTVEQEVRVAVENLLASDRPAVGGVGVAARVDEDPDRQ